MSIELKFDVMKNLSVASIPIPSYSIFWAASLALELNHCMMQQDDKYYQPLDCIKESAKFSIKELNTV